MHLCRRLRPSRRGSPRFLARPWASYLLHRHPLDRASRLPSIFSSKTNVISRPSALPPSAVPSPQPPWFSSCVTVERSTSTSASSRNHSRTRRCRPDRSSRRGSPGAMAPDLLWNALGPPCTHVARIPASGLRSTGLASTTHSHLRCAMRSPRDSRSLSPTTRSKSSFSTPMDPPSVAAATLMSSGACPIQRPRTRCARREAPRASSLCVPQGRERKCMAPAWAQGVSFPRSATMCARGRTHSFSSLRSGWVSCPGQAGQQAYRFASAVSARRGSLFLGAGSTPLPPFAGGSSTRSQDRPRFSRRVRSRRFAGVGIRDCSPGELAATPSPPCALCCPGSGEAAASPTTKLPTGEDPESEGLDSGLRAVPG